jgi:protein-tyrosine phosphatase
MTDTSLPGAVIPLASIANLRDLGGWPTGEGGLVQRGLLFRSAELDKLADEDLRAFARLGIRTIYDLRTEAERGPQPDRLPDGVEHIVLDILADSTSAAPAQVIQVLGDPKAAEELLGGGRAISMFEHAYRELVHLPSALTGYQRFFSDIAQAEHRPALFHCTTGKDRTGWAAAAMLMLLGVSDENVMRDYLLTNDELLPLVQPFFDGFQAAGGDPELLKPVLGVRPEYLQASLDEMHERFGTIEEYFSNGLHIDRATQQTLRSTYTDASDHA